MKQGVLFGLFVFGFVMLCVMVGYFGLAIATKAYYVPRLKNKTELLNRTSTGVTLVDRSNKPFFSFYKTYNHTFVPLSEIPKDMQEAVIAMEDKEFYRHPGYSVRGIGRAIVRNIQSGQVAHGGSTITQQVIKNSVLTPKKSFFRKLQEIILAQEMEWRYSKKDILEMYLNTVYFGEGAMGVEEAARTYFAKKASELTLAEASLLTGLIVSPTSLSPVSRGEASAKERQKLVLRAMRTDGYITAEEEKKAIAKKLTYADIVPTMNVIAPHFAVMVREQLEAKYGKDVVARASWTVRTTLDLEWQKQAEQTLEQGIAGLRGRGATNGAAVVIDPDNGEVRALVGSHNWDDPENGKINMATSPRQPGSSFKPLVYAAAFEKGLLTPASVLSDKKTTFARNWTPENFDKRFRGQVLARRALANSLNIPSVEVMQKVGVAEMLAFAKNLGITTLGGPSDYGPSLVLGTGEVTLLELVNAYGVFAAGGVYHEPTSILEVKDALGNVVYAHTPHESRVIDDETAFLVSSILSDEQSRSEAFGSLLNTRVDAAVKTGTTDRYKDSLAVGYTQDVVVGVWVGNNDATSMDSVTGAIGAVPLWKTLIERFAPSLFAFTPPGGIERVTICPQNGLPVKSATTSALTEYFAEGTVPTKECYLAAPPPTDIAKSEGAIGGTEILVDTKESEKKDEQKKEEVITPTPTPPPSPTVTPTPMPQLTPQP